MRRSALISAVAALCIAQASLSHAAVNWPASQVLPSFSTPAATQDLVVLTGSPADELPLFASLKAVVNATQPRIFSYEGDDLAEGRYTWLQSLGLGWTEVSDRWTLITKYRSEIQGLVVWDPAQPDTMNLACVLASSRKALVAAPSVLARLQGAPYSLPILVDLRGQYGSKTAVYQAMFNTYWPSLQHKVIFGLSPQNHLASSREYAQAIGAAVVWLDPRVAAENTLLNSFFTSMGQNGVYMGWWPEEASGVDAASRFGIGTVASDFSTNLTLHSGMSRTVNVKPVPAKPTLQNKMYVAFILSDGDNLQYVEHLMRKLWNDPGRGQVPIGWTVSAAMMDAMPGALNYYYTSGTANDDLVSGPSGYGYAYPNSMPQAQLDNYVTRTEDYTRRAGLKIVTVWNTITGGINTNVGQTFALRAPSLLGLTAQNTGGGLTIYTNGTARIPGFALSCNYCTNEQAMKDFIATAAAGWPGNAPRFILIQAQPWQGVTPTSFLNVKNSLNSNYVVLRPDNWFQLLREANGLPVNPAGTPTATATRTPTPTTGATPTFTATATRTSTPTATVPGTGTTVTLPYNVNAHYSDGTTFSASGGIDGVGYAYSSNLMGSSFTWSGTNFSFGPASALNGVRNTTVTLPAGQFTTLLLLATGVNGDQASQTVRVNYTDGTSSTFTQTFSNWLNANQNVAGQSIARTFAYRNRSTGVADSRAFNLFGYSFALTGTKTVASLVLPATNNVVVLAATLRTGTVATPTSTATATATTGATATRTATATATPTTGGGACAGVPAFATCTAYPNGSKVVFNNTLYHTIANVPATRDCPPNSPFDPSNDNWWVNDGGC